MACEPSLLTSPSKVPLYNRYESLELDGQARKDADEDPSKLKGCGGSAAQGIPLGSGPAPKSLSHSPFAKKKGGKI